MSEVVEEDVMRRRVGQPGGGTDLSDESQQPEPLVGRGKRLSPGGDARIYPLVGGEADRSRCSIVRVPEEPGVEMVVRHLDPGDYVAIDEVGAERKFTVDAGSEDAVVQGGKGHETTGPGGSTSAEVEILNVGQATNALPAGVLPTEEDAPTAKDAPVEPAGAAEANGVAPAADLDAPTKKPRNDPNGVHGGGRRLEDA